MTRKRRGDSTETLDDRHARRRTTHGNAKTGTDDAATVSEDDYILTDTLRYVKPYLFTFKVNVKRRWVDKPFLSVFSKEFPHFDWIRECSLGNVCINSAETPLTDPESYVLRDGDWVDHKVHRHESPVHNFSNIQILTDGVDLVAISKPASVPIHPCGTFRKNSLTYLLRLQHGLTDLFGIHRIDRQTSGLVMFAKSTATAKRVAEEIRERKVEKTYLALTTGQFVESEVVCRKPLIFDPTSKRASVCEENGKVSETVFHRQWYDPKRNVSLITCQPRTGRTHQIRIHLSHLGHPIANDAKYGLPVTESRETAESSTFMPEIGQQAREDGRRIHCQLCPSILPRPDDVGYNHYEAGYIFLHALRYSGPGWSFEAEPPAWATAGTI